MISDHHQSHFLKPHKSLINAFFVLSVIATCNSPFVVITDIMCLTSNYYETLVENLSLLTQAVLYSSCTAAIIIAMVFFNTFHDAVFIQEPITVYKIGLFFAVCNLDGLNPDREPPVGI